MYPIDRRFIANRVYILLNSLRKTAVVLQVSHSTIARWLKNKERKHYERKIPSRSAQVVGVLRSILKSSPFTTIQRMKQIILETLNIVVSKQLISAAIASNGYTRKKARYVTICKNHNANVNDFLIQRTMLLKSKRNWFSLDETSFGRNCKSEYGYAPKGEKIRIERDVKRLKATSAMVLINDDKIIKWEIKHDAYTTESFYEFLVSIDFPPNSVLLLDNVRFHHSKLIKEYANMISLHLLYTPPYSPWFNPIEGVFSVVKRDFYKNGNIKQAFQGVTKKQLKAFFDHSMRIVSNEE